MEDVRDIVIIIFGITATITSIVLLVISIKLYPRASDALERLGRAADDVQGAVEGARSGIRKASSLIDVVQPALPGIAILKWTYRGATSLPRAARFISRLRKRKESAPLTGSDPNGIP